MILRIAVSFPIAFATIGLAYSLLWFGITFFRNILVDLISAKGSDPRDWSSRDINFENATQSLFWTGFSVPLLTLVKLKTEMFFLAAHLIHPVFQQVIRFFTICFTNGAYIAFHNRLRGFNEKVIRANFFRSVFAWPPATLFSFLGDYLFIPSIVQAKFWSDFMAALIEGIGKSTRQVFLSKRDLLEILPSLYAENKKERTIAMLDLLHIWAVRRKGKTSLRQILDEREKTVIPSSLAGENLKKPLVDSGLRGAEITARLKELFLADGAFLSLTEFLIREFEGKNAFALNALVANHYPRFCTWIKDFRE
jgi:hypothetical protein